MKIIFDPWIEGSAVEEIAKLARAAFGVKVLVTPARIQDLPAEARSKADEIRDASLRSAAL